MQRYKLNPNFNASTNTSSSSQISLPPKPHLQDPPSISPFLQPSTTTTTTTTTNTTHLVPLSSDESELSIFNAERYFNDLQYSTDPPKKLSPISERRDLSPITPNSFHTTPTASSEASWNSQIGLLKNPPGSLSVTVKSFPLPLPHHSKPSSSSPCLRLFRLSCPCSGHKSVHVKHTTYYSSPQTPTLPSTNHISLQSDHHLNNSFPSSFSLKQNDSFRFCRSAAFSFPILTSPNKDVSDDPARHSLEVFQPPLDKIFKVCASPKLRSPVDDDLASDASSDLFEIESLSTQINSRRSYSIDEISSIGGFEPKKLPGILPVQRSIEEELYPPSEVSVAWSVTTAEGFDRNFSSAGSEFEDRRFEAVGGEGKKGISVGGLLSCRSEKAVCVVAPQMVRFGPGVQRRVGSSGFAVEPDRVVGLARLGELNAVRDGAGLMLGPRSARMNRMVQPINARVY